MKVHVLGAGPAGLAAAHAATLAGADVTIYTERESLSHLYGAQYLHEPIPDATTESPVRLSYRLQGTAQDYRIKVYGTSWDGQVSPEDLEEEHDAWDIRSTYEHLWRMYRPQMESARFWPGMMADYLALMKKCQTLVVSTIPAKSLCAGYNLQEPGGLGSNHTFRWREIWAAGETPDISLPYACDLNTVICNGERSPSWYRLSNVFGVKTIEWPGVQRFVPVPTATKVPKPIVTNCNCWLSPNYLRVGRYGAWDKTQLVHDAFNRTYDRVKEGWKS